MNLDLREAIMQRVQNKSKEELSDIIESAIGSDERSLPGIGVLFELMWQHLENDVKETLINTLHEQIMQKA